MKLKSVKNSGKVPKIAEMALSECCVWTMTNLEVTLTPHDGKGQIISECPLEILDFPKIHRKIWQISALESNKVVKS